MDIEELLWDEDGLEEAIFAHECATDPASCDQKPGDERVTQRNGYKFLLS